MQGLRNSGLLPRKLPSRLGISPVEKIVERVSAIDAGAGNMSQADAIDKFVKRVSHSIL